MANDKIEQESLMAMGNIVVKNKLTPSSSLDFIK